MQTYEIEEDEIDIAQLFKTLKKNLLGILFITFLVTSLVAAYVYFLPSIYSSSVSISFDDQKSSKLTTIIPEDLDVFGNSESELETIKLTLKTENFINSVLDQLNLEKSYFIESNYKNIEVDAFDNLEVDLTLNNTAYALKSKKTLYGEFFTIKPIDDEKFTLVVKALDYEGIHNYEEQINHGFFTLIVRKIADFTAASQSIVLKDKSLLAEEVLKNMDVTILSDNVMKISYQNTVAIRAKRVLDVIAKQFIADTLEKKTIELSQTLAFLDSQISNVRNTLQNAGDKLKNYQQENKTFAPKESSANLFTDISKKEEMLTELVTSQRGS